ncbi:hypothetical protein P3S67_004845 [Capsicum chacoense]
MMILEKMEDSFIDNYKKLVGYANALLESNVGSDGLLEAVKIVLPNAMHRYFMRHIEANREKKWKNI